MKVRGSPLDLSERELHQASLDAPLPSKALELVHVTQMRSALKILEDRKLKTRQCSHFKAERVYCFWGRPAYRVPNSNDSSDLLQIFPAVFILRPPSGETPSQVFPFDTGAAANGYYNTSDPTAFIENYELAPQLEAAGRHISWAFGSNSDYYDANFTLDLSLYDPAWLDVRGFHLIARLASRGMYLIDGRPDYRACTIEVGYGHDIVLQGTLEFVVLPDKWIQGSAPAVRASLESLQKMRARIVPYEWHPHLSPENHMGQISDLVREDFRTRGMIV